MFHPSQPQEDAWVFIILLMQPVLLQTLAEIALCVWHLQLCELENNRTAVVQGLWPGYFFGRINTLGTFWLGCPRDRYQSMSRSWLASCLSLSVLSSNVFLFLFNILSLFHHPRNDLHGAHLKKFFNSLVGEGALLATRAFSVISIIWTTFCLALVRAAGRCLFK